MDHLQRSLYHFSFFGAIAIASYKGGIGELSNKAVTDFEIAKNSSGFSLAFF
jgi:hypothetical protein